MLTLNRWPVDTISNWLARSTEDRERIQPGIVTKDLLPVFGFSNIILRFELLALFIEVFNGCLVLSRKHQMELQEGSHEAHYDKINHEPDDNLNLECQFGATPRQGLGIDAPLDGTVKLIRGEKGCEVCHDEDVNQEKQKVFAVPEADAIVDPRAVVVHVEDTSVAG